MSKRHESAGARETTSRAGSGHGGPVAVGAPAPDLLLGSTAERRLSELLGAPVVVVFTSDGWDPTSREHVDAYNRVIERVEGLQGVRLLCVGANGPWRDAHFDDAALDVPVVLGDVEQMGRAFGVERGPAVFVLDERGVVRWRHVAGEHLPAPDELAVVLAALAAAEPRTQTAVSNAEPAAVPGAWSRRGFVAAALGAGIALTLAPLARRAEAAAHAASHAASPQTSLGAVRVTLRVNGRELPLDLEPRVTLLDALREYAGLTGTKKGCDHGQCGACTVHVDGRRVLSCMSLAVMQQGKAITTIEGLAAISGATGDALHPMQQAFLDHDGFQCGYCTPGQIMSATAVLHEPWGPDDDEVREAMSGNICRCGAYPNIVAAVQSVRGTQTARGAGE